MDVTFQTSLSIAHGGSTAAGGATVEYDLDASGLKAFNVQTLSTTAADINIGALTWSNATILHVQNHDTTNDVIIVKGGDEIFTIPPNSTNLYTLMGDGVAIQAKSSAGTPQIGITVAGPLA